jgi:predicted DNA-binding transcriptional regulator AlpA
MTHDDLLTPRKVAQMLGISSRTLAVWRCEKRYNLQYIKIGACVRYRQADVLRFIDQGTHASERGDASVRT